MATQISAEERVTLQAIAKSHDVELLLLFGSSVTPAKIHEHSDVDIAVRFRSPLADMRHLLELQADLQDVLPTRTLDLSELRHADPLFLKKICENCQLLAGDPQQLAQLKITAFRRYIDHRRYFAMEREYARRVLAHLTERP